MYVREKISGYYNDVVSPFIIEDLILISVVLLLVVNVYSGFILRVKENIARITYDIRCHFF